MKTKKYIYLGLTILTPIALFIACSSSNPVRISSKDVEFISKTKEETIIKVNIKNLSQDTKKDEISLYFSEKTEQTNGKIIYGFEILKDYVSFKISNLEVDTSYVLSKIQFNNRVFNIDNVEFIIPKEEPSPVEPTEPKNPTEPADPKKPTEPKKLEAPIKPTLPIFDQKSEDKIFEIQIKPEASNKYASEFLLNNNVANNDFQLNKNYFNISNSANINESDVKITATSFDDATGKLAINVSGKNKSNNFNFVLNSNLDQIENYPLQIFEIKNKTSKYEISKTDQQRINLMKNVFNSNFVPSLATDFFDFKIGFSSNDTFSYPHLSFANVTNNFTIDEKSRNLFDDMKASFDYKIIAEIWSLKKGSTKISITNPQRYNGNSFFYIQKFGFLVSKQVKGVFESIKINQTVQKSISKVFPSFLYALDKSQGEPEINSMVELSLSEPNYKNYTTENHGSLTANIQNIDLYIKAMNSLITSDYQNDVVQWFKTKNINFEYTIESNQYSDIKGEFLLNITAKNATHSSTKRFSKKIKVEEFKKITDDDFKNKLGFYVKFNDDPGLTEQETGYNWDTLITRNKINVEIDSLNSGATTSWQTISTNIQNGILKTLNDASEQPKYLQLKYKDFIMNLYNKNKWPFPINWGNDYAIKVTKIEYNKVEKEIRFHYTLTLHIMDNGNSVEYNRNGISTAKLSKEIVNKKEMWKISGIS